MVEALGGATRTVAATKRIYRQPQAHLVLDIVDEHGARTPARVAVLASDGRAYAPRTAWMQADDSFDRAVQTSETHYFECAPPCALDVPAGPTRILVQHGFAYAPWQQTVTAAAGSESRLRAQLQPQRLPAAFGHWISADLHIHMNYGGHYHNTPAHLAQQARAEDLDLAWDLVVNKEQRFPDIASFRTDADPASTPRILVLHGQEYHTSLWGHLGLLGLDDHLLMPGFASYRHTAMASPYPTNGVIADLAHAEGGVVGYVHPFDTLPDPVHDAVLTDELPADVIHGKVDYIEVMGFSDHKATAQVWYRLLNLGFHLPTGAGTDAMANYASLRGPVGLNRVFLDTGGKLDKVDALTALKAGHGFASNGPLLGLLLDGAKPGDTARRTRQASLPRGAALAGGGRSSGTGAERQGGEDLHARRRSSPLRRRRARSTSPAAGCCCAPGTTAPTRCCSICIPTPPPIRSGSATMCWRPARATMQRGSRCG